MVSIQWKTSMSIDITQILREALDNLPEKRLGQVLYSFH